MKQYDNFTLLENKYISEYRSQGYYFRHDQSGAEVFIIQNDDDENFFSFGFRTPSENHYGLAHILEHSVLAGSKHYPIKDPFITLLRSSMQTFLNAMTYPDKTLYPAASPVKQDFFNLFDVYGDAVFFPLIKKETFWQEGYRLLYDSTIHTLKHTGVVYNEMKGAYSSIESYAYDAVVQSLHPTNSYQYDSGGHPDYIPQITYKMLVNFHKKYYHPNNSKIFFYGNIPLEEKLSRLHEKFLQHFHNTTASNSVIQEEKPFNKRSYEVREFPSQNNDDTSYISLNWLTAPLTDPKTILALDTLNQILLGTSGSPLYVALQTSGLGQDLSPVCGFSFDFNRAIFSAGLRGIDPKNQHVFEQMVDESLQEIVRKGISKEIIEASLRTVEMQRREIRSGSFGLRLMNRLYRSWNYDVNPFDAIFFETPMTNLRKEAFTDNYFESLIEKYLILNPHSSLTLITPNAQLSKTKELATNSELDLLLKDMSETEKELLLEENQLLSQHQNTEDDPAIVPCLNRTDIPQKVKNILTHEEVIFLNRPLYVIEQFTNGVYYWNVAFNLNDFEQADLLWLPFFCRAMSGMGSNKRSYIEMAQAISRDSGGLNFILDTGEYLNNEGKVLNHSAMLYISFKALSSQINAMPATLREALFEIDFNNIDRLQSLYWELYNEISASVVPSGSGVINLRLSRLFNESSYIEELWHGVEQLLFLESLQKKWKEPDFADKLIRKFQSFAHHIFSQERAIFGFVAPDNSQAKKTLIEIFNSLPQDTSVSIFPSKISFSSVRNEVITTGTEVNFIGVALPAHSFYEKARASEILLGQFLTVDSLWHAIRMQGGAYGVSAGISNGSANGVFTMTSYRDPHIKRTIDVFKHSFENFSTISQADLNNTLIARIGKENRTQGPQEMLALAMKRKIYNISVSLRQKLRDYLLEVTPSDIKLSAESLNDNMKNAKIAILTNDKQIKDINDYLKVNQVIHLSK